MREPNFEKEQTTAQQIYWPCCQKVNRKWSDTRPFGKLRADSCLSGCKALLSAGYLLITGNSADPTRATFSSAKLVTRSSAV